MSQAKLRKFAKSLPVVGPVVELVTPEPRRRRAPRSRGERKRGGGGRATVIPVDASVAAGSVMSGPRYSFRQVTKNGMTGMELTWEGNWCQVQTDSTPGSTKILTQQGGAANQALPFDPDNTAMMPNTICAFAQNFVRYSVEEVELLYRAGCPTSTAGSICLAWDTDAGDTFGTSVTSLSNITQSVQGPPWKDMSLRVKNDATMRYIYNSAAAGSLSVAEKRQDQAGQVVGAYSLAPAAVNALGWLRLRTRISFFELNVTAQQSSLLRRLPKGLCEQCLQCNARELSARSGIPVESFTAGVAHQVTDAREEKKEPSISSPEASPQESLSGGWVRAPSLREWSEPRATLTREGQAAGLVKSQSHKA